MLRELEEIFEGVIELDPTVLNSNFFLKQGLYLKFDLGKTIEDNISDISDENTLFVSSKFKNEDELYAEGLDLEKYDWFRRRDYLSNWLNANKAITDKKIHNTNYLTLFFKKSTFLYENDIDKPVNSHLDSVLKLDDDIRDMVADVIKLRDGTKKIEDDDLVAFMDANYGEFYRMLIDESRISRRDRLVKCVRDGMHKIQDYVNSLEIDDGDYVKIFFDVDVEDYAFESDVYLFLKSFAVNTYNVFNDEGKLIGISPNDVSYNAKKPFLEMLSNSILVRERLDFESVTLRRQLYEWIVGATFRNPIVSSRRFTDSGDVRLVTRYFVDAEKDSTGTSTIVDFDVLPFDKNDELDESVRLIDYLGVKGSDSYGTVSEMWHIKDRLSKLFFGGKLPNLMSTKDARVSDTFNAVMVTEYLRMHDSLIDWFEKGYELGAKHMIDRVTYRILKSRIHGLGSFGYYDLIDMLNYRWFLLNYLDVGEKASMGDRVLDVREWFGTAVLDKYIVIDSEDKFVFVAGQVLAYLDNQSAAMNTNLGYVDRLMRLNKGSQLKSEVRRLTRLYGHEVKGFNIRFKDVVSELLLSDVVDKLTDENRDILLAGYLARNAFYVSTKDSVEEGE